MDFNELNLLLVDDSEEILAQVKEALGGIGISNVTTAINAEIALELLKENDFNFIISDYVMPNIDGIEFLKRIRSNDETKGIPFIMLTSDGNRQTVLMLLSNNGNGFIVKPPTTQKLEGKIKEVLSHFS